MDFNNPQVRQRVVEHILFAVQSVGAAFPLPETPARISEEEFIREFTIQLRNPIIMQVLSFTLALDHELKNTLSGLAPHL